MKLWFNLLCRDIDAQLAFYQHVLDLPEAASSRSAIYCALETADFQFGFNAKPAYELLGLTSRQPIEGVTAPTIAYATFMVETPSRVDAVADLIGSLGGTIVKAPFETYYGQWQTVLADPERNVFRVAAVMA
ncbi:MULTISPECIES: VOC family protein [Cupriavidus]|uniref:Bleomycin resistance protein n=1 Tax=Cupriavidus pauculus TaxID=82633 RepID=A0A3G8HA49_9BURK|nr:VOC family protein [Cupriavidus pauculus]AZG17218.1 bleomycin resistance protein [Cupriavidus pauculus]